jgi:hypothetical protein
MPKISAKKIEKDRIGTDGSFDGMEEEEKLGFSDNDNPDD